MSSFVNALSLARQADKETRREKLGNDDFFEVMQKGAGVVPVLGGIQVPSRVIQQAAVMGGDRRSYGGMMNAAVKGHQDAVQQLTALMGTLNQNIDGKSLTLNLYQDRAVGLVTDRYTALPHEELVQAMTVLPLREDGLREVYITDEGEFRIRLVLAELGFRALSIKLDASNGITGSTSLRMMGGLFRLVCTNGMTVRVGEGGGGSSTAHVGGLQRLRQRMDQILTDTRNVSVGMEAAAYVQLDVRLAIGELFAHGRIAAAEAKLAILRITEGREQGTEVEGSSTTQWGLAQALSAAARDYAHGRRSHLEVLAGAVLMDGLPKQLFTPRRFNPALVLEGK